MKVWELTAEELADLQLYQEPDNESIGYERNVADEAQRKLWSYILNNIPIGRTASGEAETDRLQELNRSFDFGTADTWDRFDKLPTPEDYD
uniref:Uncharacterized protein n=1 Tax=viral metagenome TaxID=1070528 RepID=A0A6M3LJD6_9ZZZZ